MDITDLKNGHVIPKFWVLENLYHLFLVRNHEMIQSFNHIKNFRKSLTFARANLGNRKLKKISDSCMASLKRQDDYLLAQCIAFCLKFILQPREAVKKVALLLLSNVSKFFENYDFSPEMMTSPGRGLLIFWNETKPHAYF